MQEISAEDYDSTKDGLPAENTYSDPTAGQTYVYAENGNLASETNRLGVTTNYQYNDVGAKIKESFDIYEFNYTDDGNPLNVKIGGAETISYTYDDSGNLVSESYANGDSIRYEYDNNGNVMYQYHNDDTEPYAVFGFSDDNILQGKFSLDSDLYTFYKDDGTIETYRYSDESLVMSYDRKITDADEENNIDRRTDISETHFGKNYTSVIKDNSIRYSHGNKSYEYSVTENDNYQIVSENINAYGIDAISSSYEYDENDNIIQKTINSIENTITINNAYDSKGRIIETSYNHANPVKFSYADEQLSRTDCKLLNYSELYTYDSRGNILSAEVYDYTNGAIDNQTPKETTQFYYENDGWSDRLLDVNGNALTYDANTMYFQYDEHQSPIGFIYNENQYYYITNISGDIIAITESNGLGIAEYFYDAWGNVEYIEAINANYEAVAEANPLRYRGYYLDSETGYYYLQSRYYDPSICRFINADIPNIAQQYKEDINGLNVFAYCCNEPINHIDCNGYWGADIHYGRDHKKGKNYDGTYEWAILAKFKSKYATEIAKGDVDVDDNKNTTPNPLKAINADTGLANRQKYHFNRAPSGKTDTRTEQGNRFYKSAVSSFKSAIKNYNSNKAILDKQFFNKNDKKYKNLLSGLQRERDCKIALACFVLGKALHCYQDIYSHGNIAAGVATGKYTYRLKGHTGMTGVDSPYYNWKSGSNKTKVVKESKLSRRYYDTRDKTKTILLNFLYDINQSSLVRIR